MLRTIKAVDLYRKATSDLQTSTALGGILSIITFSVISYLLFTESLHYFTSAPKPYLLVEPHSDEDFMILSVNISFFSTPCNSLVIFYTDTNAEHYKFYSLPRSVLDKEGNIISIGSSEVIEDQVEGCGSCFGAESTIGQCCNSCADVMEAYGRKRWKPPQFADIDQCKKFLSTDSTLGPGCMLAGDLKIKKVPGSIRFKNTLNLNRGSLNFYNGFHRVDHFLFTDPNAQTDGLKGPIDGLEIREGFRTSYYLKLVPAITTKGRFYQASANNLISYHPMNPEVIFTYDIEPISTIYKDEKSLSGFIVSICAIIGGWYAITLLLVKVLIK